MDIRPLVKVDFEDIVVDAFSVDKPTNMSTRPGLMIEFKGNLNSISLKEN